MYMYIYVFKICEKNTLTDKTIISFQMESCIIFRFTKCIIQFYSEYIIFIIRKKLFLDKRKQYCFYKISIYTIPINIIEVGEDFSLWCLEFLPSVDFPHWRQHDFRSESHGDSGGTTEQISANHSCFWGAHSKLLCLYEINNKASQITNANGKLRTLERG